MPWVYLIPLSAISKSTFPISRLEKLQIPHPEKALLGPLDYLFTIIKFLYPENIDLADYGRGKSYSLLCQSDILPFSGYWKCFDFLASWKYFWWFPAKYWRFPWSQKTLLIVCNELLPPSLISIPSTAWGTLQLFSIPYPQAIDAHFLA